MRLRDVAGLDLTIVRDGAFSSLGLVSHDATDMLVFVEDDAYLEAVERSPGVSAVIASPAIADRVAPTLGLAVSDHPREAFYALHNRLVQRTDFYGAPVATQVAPSARVHERAFVADHDVRIGEGVVVQAGAVIHAHTTLDDDVVVRAGSVIGGEGFQVVAARGRILRVAHAGGVRLRAGVDVHSNCCVDRALFAGWTEVGELTTIDNLVYVAHNVRIGRRCRIAAHATIGGSAVIGDDVWIGLSATVRDGIVVGAGASVSMGAVVTRAVPPGERVTGNFAVPHDRFVDTFRRSP